MEKKQKKDIVIYQTKSGAVAFRGDVERETVWGTLQQVADLFDVQKPAISKHLRNIYESGELERGATVSKMETVQKEGSRTIKRTIDYYNLDAMLSVGYRVNSRQATQFRIWATKTLRQYIVQGYAINRDRIGANYEQFMRAVADVKALLPSGNKVKTEDIVELISAFAGTWFSLDAYDKAQFPTRGATKRQVAFTATHLRDALVALKTELIGKKEATEIFGEERARGSIEGIVGNVMQSAFGADVYPTVEEKAAHLLYFVIKNHPFVDGNKRSGAFAFVWFLRRARLLRASMTPEALTALTLLVAESQSKDKEKMVGLILLILGGKKK